MIVSKVMFQKPTLYLYDEILILITCVPWRALAEKPAMSTYVMEKSGLLFDPNINLISRKGDLL